MSVKATAQLKPTSPFRLLDLPPELRDKIFAYALSSPTGYVCFGTESRAPSQETNWLTLRPCPRASRPYEPLTENSPYRHGLMHHITRTPSTTQGQDRPLYLGLPLLLACSLVYREARHHLYAQNTFILSTTQLVGQSNTHIRYRIQHIWVSSGFGQGHTAVNDSQYPLTTSLVLQSLSLLAYGKASGWGIGLKSITLSLAHDSAGLASMIMRYKGFPGRFGRFCDVLEKNRETWEAIDADDDGDGMWMNTNKNVAAIAKCLAVMGESSKEIMRYKLSCQSMKLKTRKVNKEKVTRRLEISGNYGAHLVSAYAPPITQLRDAFGGEFWFNNGSGQGGILCAVDGIETYDLFKQD